MKDVNSTIMDPEDSPERVALSIETEEFLLASDQEAISLEEVMTLPNNSFMHSAKSADLRTASFHEKNENKILTKTLANHRG